HLRARLGALAHRIDGTFLIHRTDRSMHLTLLSLHGVLSSARNAGSVTGPDISSRLKMQEHIS
ncbi:MAG: hypothetical protein K8F25_08990, partial [Fimbriimonadaceae bacterium]|nr:hypothetical protein [Alphaproteobacteria bacterium]